MLGKLLDGRYQVTQVLGAGGFGETYIGQDTRRPGNPSCVVKHLKPASSDPNFLEVARRLFNTEAETLEQLGEHEQIPRLLAYFEEEREFFLVQEFVQGHTLTTELLGRRWTENQTIQMLEEILIILEFVHSRGVIHRDIKPDNIIRRASDNKLVLVDFGAVKQVRTQMAGNYGQFSATVAVGTPGYMPSEQGRGQPRQNSDIYSLGVIGIQSLIGLVPQQFPEDPTTGEIVWQHLVSVSPGLGSVLSRMVQYHFKDRYQSATEALYALRQLYNAPPPVQQYQAYPSYPPTVHPPAPQAPSVPVPPSPSEQYTVPVSPANVSHSTVSSEPSYYAPTTTTSNKLPIVLALAAIAVVGGVAIAMYQQSQQNGTVVRNNTAQTQQEACTVAIGSLNVRSGPSRDSAAISGVSRGTTVSLTGNTQNGWAEISSPVKGWVFRDPQYISCPTDGATSTPTPTPSPQPTAGTTDPGDAILAKAAERYQAGDLQSAIALARAIPASSAASGRANQAIARWQQEWSVAETKYREAELAFNQGRWNDVIASGRDPQFPNNRHWRTRLNQLVSRAQERQKQETPAPTPTPTETPTPTPTPTETPTETPPPTETPTETPPPPETQVPIEVPPPES